MKTEMIRKNNTDIALIHSQQCLIQDAASALDFVMNVKYETGCTNIAVNKEAVAKEFFVLSNCLAGEILQKLVTYGIRLALYGDFTGYTSKPLKDLMYESNMGRDFYFQPDIEQAIEKLSA